MKRKWGKRGLLLLVLVAVSIGGSSINQAQEFPAKPVTLIIPFGPGGASDLTARAFVGAAPEYLGQPIIIQLRPGGEPLLLIWWPKRLPTATPC